MAVPLSKRAAALVLAALAWLVAASCSGQPRMRLDEISAPPGARMGVDEGAYEVHLDRVTAEVRRRLEEKYGDSEVALYALPPDAGWDAVIGFYEARLAQKGLKRDTGFPSEHPSYKLAVWADSGWMSRRAVAAAFVEAGRTQDGTPLKFLAVFSTD